MTPDIEALILPDLSAGLRQAAPGVTLVVQNEARHQVALALEEGAIDLTIDCNFATAARPVQQGALRD